MSKMICFFRFQGDESRLGRIASNGHTVDAAPGKERLLDLHFFAETCEYWI
jgi:hypothetical protein